MIEIVDSRASHIRKLANDLRLEDEQEIRRFGLLPIEAVYLSYKYSCYRKTALIDSNVAAMWGAAGPLLADKAQAFLLTTNAVTRISPIRFVRIYRQEVGKMKQLFPNLEVFVDPRYKKAIAVLELIGAKRMYISVVNNEEFYIYNV